MNIFLSTGRLYGACYIDVMQHTSTHTVKDIRFSLKYRPDFLQELPSRRELTTTRLFDDKNLMVGDTVNLVITETGEHVATGRISNIRTIGFAELFAATKNFQGTLAMYQDYYMREVAPTTEAKDITIELLEAN